MISLKNTFRISRVIIFFLSILIFHSCKKEEVPTLTTTEITNITGTTASSGGTITDEGTSTVLSRGVCWSTGTTPTIADNHTADGAGAGIFNSNLTNLDAATVYYVRAYATNNEGTGYGMAMSFKTLGTAPIAVTKPATDITTTGAILNALVNPNYISTSVIFEYGMTASYGNTVTTLQSPITGNLATNVSANIEGLSAGATYHFRVKSVNSEGTVYGDDLTFKSLGQVPTVTISVATNLTAESAQLNGVVNANYLESTVTFEYGLTTNYGDAIIATPGTSTGSVNTNVKALISGLSTATTYHYRIKAVNLLGTTYSNDGTFTTLGQSPTVLTLAVSNVSTTDATLNGSVNANYLNTAVTFEYGTTISYGTTVAATQSPVSGNTNTNVSATITGLTEGLTYYYRIVAVNSLGTTNGNDMTFTAGGYVIGQSAFGGIIFYLDGTELHGLVCAPSDQSTNTMWGCYGTTITGADGTSVGTGYQNTKDIINGCSTIGIAARICYDLELNGYDDWYLPSLNELGLMYTNLKAKGLGEFTDSGYWSSSEKDYNHAWHQLFLDGSLYAHRKDTKVWVRAIRSF